MHASTKDILIFLSDMRNSLDNNRFHPICRKKNLDTLARLGITWEDAKAEIYALQVSDYISGPEVDRDDPSSDFFWKFKKSVLGQVIYIKLKIEYLRDSDVRVVSFHIDWI